MKATILLMLISIISFASASEEKTILSCNEKFSSLVITQHGNNFKIERSVLLGKVKGTRYVRGGYSLEASGEFYANSFKAEKNQLTFSLDEGKYLKFNFVLNNKSENLNVEISSNVEFVADQINEMLAVSQQELQFSIENSCIINP